MADKMDFEIPDAMRSLATNNMAEARKAFEQFMEAAQQATDQVEGSASKVQDSARSMNREAMKFAEESMTQSFAYAEKMLKAGSVTEFMALQQEYLRAQMDAFSGKAKDFAEMATKATKLDT